MNLRGILRKILIEFKRKIPKEYLGTGQHRGKKKGTEKKKKLSNRISWKLVGTVLHKKEKCFLITGIVSYSFYLFSMTEIIILFTSLASLKVHLPS